MKFTLAAIVGFASALTKKNKLWEDEYYHDRDEMTDSDPRNVAEVSVWDTIEAVKDYTEMLNTGVEVDENATSGTIYDAELDSTYYWNDDIPEYSYYNGETGYDSWYCGMTDSSGWYDDESQAWGYYDGETGEYMNSSETK